MSQLTRRQFLKNAGLTAGGLAFGGLTGTVGAAAYECNFDQLPVTQYTIDSAVLPMDFSAKIIFISDMHINSYGVDLETAERIVAQINERKPDVVLNGGDIVNNTIFNHNYFKGDPTPDDIAGVMKKLQFPTFSVNGNHDIDKCGDRMACALENVGIRTLENSFESITVKGVDFNVVGLPDYKTRWRYFAHRNSRFAAELYEQALDRPSIILSHDPITYRYMPENPQALVQLSGHTHGGQITIGSWIPYKPTAGTPDEWMRGEVNDKKGKKAPMVVTTGVGTSQLALRTVAPEMVEMIVRGPQSGLALTL